ncbi:MAG: thermonuclease family protein [Armatimonadota bacterium]
MRFATLVSVVDATRVDVRIDGAVRTVQMPGIEEPARSPFGARAREFIGFRLGSARFGVIRRAVGRDGVWLADLVAPGSDKCLQHEMVRRGLAVWRRELAPDRVDLAAAQSDAVRSGVGTWGAGLDESPIPVPAPPSRPATRVRERSTENRLALAVAFSAATVALLGASAVLGGPARRLSRRRVQVAAADEGPVKIVGTIRLPGPGASIDGRPTRYVHVAANSWRHSGDRWIRDAPVEDSVPFLLEDGTGVLWVDGGECRFHCSESNRSVNGRAVDGWSGVGAPGDVRMETWLLREGAVVTVLGGFRRTPPSIGRLESTVPIEVVEGDLRRLVRRAGRASTLCLGAALGCVVAAAWALR